MYGKTMFIACSCAAALAAGCGDYDSPTNRVGVPPMDGAAAPAGSGSAAGDAAPAASGSSGATGALPTLKKEDLTVFAALPASFESKDNPSTEEKVALGRMLYYDARLSKNHDVSCNSCHDLANYGVDGKPVSEGHKKQTGDRNSPTVFNAAGHLAQFWDGRAADVEDQSKGPPLNPIEMAMPNEEQLVKTLESMEGYRKAFAAAFPDEEDPISFDNMAKAIGAFERKLLTPSKWDKFLAGDDTALSAKEKSGAAVFVSKNCTMCHNGPLVGGSMYQKLGLAKPWPRQEDQGRFKVTKEDKDKMFFKVPSLRNVAKTAPYFHDGKTATLKEAVTLMAKHQLDVELTAEEMDAILAFLNALTGEVDAEYTKKPELPESSDTTPKADPS